MKNKLLTGCECLLWDYNGTLVDDTRLCLEILNGQLGEIGKPILSLERYQELFDFPLIKFYQRAGFDFNREAFESVSDRFMQTYAKRRFECPLQSAAVKVLTGVKNAGIAQAVLSAYEQSALATALSYYNIESYFSQVAGPDNTRADGKVGEGRRLLEKLGISPESIILIGDTTHDYAVAQALGIRTILVASGHHSFDRLSKCGVEVMHSLDDLLF